MVEGWLTNEDGNMRSIMHHKKVKDKKCLLLIGLN